MTEDLRGVLINMRVSFAIHSMMHLPAFKFIWHKYYHWNQRQHNWELLGNMTRKVQYNCRRRLAALSSKYSYTGTLANNSIGVAIIYRLYRVE